MWGEKLKIDTIKALNGDIISDIMKGAYKANALDRPDFERILDTVQHNKGAEAGLRPEQHRTMTGAVQKDMDREKLKEACRQLEAVFVNMVFERMRSTVKGDVLTGDSFGERIFTSMLDNELAVKACSGEGLGISKIIYDHLAENLD
jgi:flagellar protein FlgJ